jgi:hypothetical protein
VDIDPHLGQSSERGFGVRLRGSLVALLVVALPALIFLMPLTPCRRLCQSPRPLAARRIILLPHPRTEQVTHLRQVEVTMPAPPAANLVVVHPQRVFGHPEATLHRPAAKGHPEQPAEGHSPLARHPVGKEVLHLARLACQSPRRLRAAAPDREDGPAGRGACGAAARQLICLVPWEAASSPGSCPGRSSYRLIARPGCSSSDLCSHFWRLGAFVRNRFGPPKFFSLRHIGPAMVGVTFPIFTRIFRRKRALWPHRWCFSSLRRKAIPTRKETAWVVYSACGTC